MNVASLELSKQLYEVSEWNDTEKWWHELKDGWSAGTPFSPGDNDIPAYDLGYLLRKLPQKLLIGRKHYAFLLTGSTSDETWVADYYLAGWQQPLPGRGMEAWMHWGDRAKLTEADTPEDAAVKLAIALFEQGVLHKGGK